MILEMTTLFQIFAFWNMNPNGHRRGFPNKKIIILVVTVTGWGVRTKV